HVNVQLVPPSAGGGRGVARSFHWRCVSIPRCARASSNVTSMVQRRTKPGQHLRGGMLQIRRQQSLRFEALLRVANQDPTDGDRRLTRVIPDRSVRSDVDLTWSFPIPIVNGQRAPRRVLVSQPRLQGRPAFPFEAGGPALSRVTRRGGSIERGIETQARDHTDTGHLRHLIEPFQSRQTTVRHKDDLAARPPAPYEPNDLPGSCQQGLLATSALFLETLGGTQHRQKGQGPDPVGP